MAQEYRGVSGTRPSATKAEEQRLALPPVADFTFLGDPGHYDVFLTDKGAEILPSLSKHLHQANLYTNDPRTGDASGSIAIRVASQGKVAIPRTLEVEAFGETGQGYTQRFVTRAGEQWHSEVWKRPYQVGSEVFFEYDRPGFWAFLRQVKADVMPALDPNIKRSLKARLARELKLAKRAKNEETIELLEQKLEAFNPPKPAKPAAKKAA